MQAKFYKKSVLLIAFNRRYVNILSNQIIFIGLRSSKNYYKRPGGGLGIWEGSLGFEFFAWLDVC